MASLEEGVFTSHRIWTPLSKKASLLTEACESNFQTEATAPPFPLMTYACLHKMYFNTVTPNCRAIVSSVGAVVSLSADQSSIVCRLLKICGSQEAIY